MQHFKFGLIGLCTACRGPAPITKQILYTQVSRGGCHVHILDVAHSFILITEFRAGMVKMTSSRDVPHCLLYIKLNSVDVVAIIPFTQVQTFLICQRGFVSLDTWRCISSFPGNMGHLSGHSQANKRHHVSFSLFNVTTPLMAQSVHFGVLPAMSGRRAPQISRHRKFATSDSKL